MPLSRRPWEPAVRAERAALRRCLLFTVAGVEYAVDLEQLTRALPLPAIPPAEIMVHGTAYPLLDLRTVFGLPPAAGRRALLAARAATQRAALVVDEILSLTAVDPADIQPLPAVFAGVEREWFAGLVRSGARVLIVVCTEGLLAARRREDRPAPRLAAAAPTRG
jgi:chemotaxis signal transduction protein